VDTNTRSVAVDGMGGDFAPLAVVDGVLLAAKSGVPVLVFGPEAELIALLSEREPAWRDLGIVVSGTSEVIEMAEEPVHAVRRKPHSSLVAAVRAVAEGKAGGVFSAGNSGALMAAAVFVLGREEGIERPAIAGVLPTLQGSVVALDLGANVDCRPHHLEQFGYLGAAYARRLFNISKPRVALLSNGAERGKGSALVKQAAELLQQSSLHFIGNVEPAAVMQHATDVVVCDGFSGNVFLKTLEATAGMFRHLLRHDAAMVRLLEERFGESAQSGARLLGVRGVVLVGHGASHAQAVARAIQKTHTIILAEK